MRALRGICAAAGTVLLVSCAPLLPLNGLRATQAAREAGQNPRPSGNSAVPEIDIVLNGARGDAIDVYLPGDQTSRRLRIAEAAATWLGVDDRPARDNDLEPDTATVQSTRRLLQRTGEGWSLAFDTSSLLAAVRAEGFDGFDLTVCHPGIETRIDGKPSPDFDPDCFHPGVGWTVTDEDVRAQITLLPKASYYVAFIAGVALSLVLLTTLAWFVGDRLRQGPFRRRTAASKAIGLVAGVGAAVSFSAVISGIGAGVGPLDNLALAKDLTAGPTALAGMLPALAGTIPGIIFGALVLRRRPWPDDPAPEVWRPWPVPPLPGAKSGGTPPPPLPGGPY